MTTSTDTVTILSSSSSFDDEEDDEDAVLPLHSSVIAVVCVTIAIVATVGGNVLILLSYGRDGQLRDVHNLYLLHLAVCDLLIGAVSMPLYLIYTVLNFTWPMGVVMCKLFLVEDYTLCCMSTLIIILVAADRLALLNLGASYQVVETRKRAYVKLTICWICSFMLYSPAILLWDEIRGYSIVPADDCRLEFEDNPPYVVTTEIIGFSVPFVSLCVINTLLYVAWRKRRKTCPNQGFEARTAEQSVAYTEASEITFVQNRRRFRKNSVSQSKLSISNRSTPKEQSARNTSDSDSSNLVTVMKPQMLTPCPEIPSNDSDDSRLPSSVSGCQQHKTSIIASPSQMPRPLPEPRRTRDQNKAQEKLKRGRKVAMILTCLVAALVVCWLPFSVSTIIMAFCEDCVNGDLFEFFFWLLWLKSCVNPYLYAYNSPRFRHNIRELFAHVALRRGK